MNKAKLSLGVGLIVLGVGMMCFDATRIVAPFVLGFGIGMSGAGASA